MVFRKYLTFFRYELGRKQRWTTYQDKLRKLDTSAISLYKLIQLDIIRYK